MFPFEMVSFTDAEFDLITTTVGRWAQRNHVEVESALGEAAMKYAVALVSRGLNSDEAIAARLNELLGSREKPPSTKSA
ncbi:hypothetical protein RHE_CH02006 [Rhizobium etli CFN 42]|uniref:Uncharacterized protein n=1 Tax=Rhizobium etli (strain ATCC 51251 / DSM 11541 / JCM 21823 / NBRC 15573 / CFN 42) TaxID=347834 RepID=Q2K8P5_RHIEC|nr:hypothetical protein [Rhizobium etli]ABC90791.1 hypothetical protein RHE_CH02006 [Rhizobium etli CFN 42]